MKWWDPIWRAIGRIQLCSQSGEGHILDPIRQVVLSAKLRYKMLRAEKGEINSHWACLGRLLRGEEILAES